MRTYLPALILVAVLASVSDKSMTAWFAVRAVAFMACAILGRPSAWAVLSSGAVALVSLDLAIACLSFSCLKVRLMTMATVCAAVGLVGAASLVWQQWAFPFHNRNHYAVFCELSLPLLVYAWRRAGHRFYIAAAAILFAAALAGGSRVGAVLLLVEVVVLAGWRNLSISIPAVAVAASLFVLLSGGQRIANPLEGDHRLEIWRSTVEMIRDKPLTGWGVGEFTRNYPAYAKFDNGQFVNAAHSDWLEWGSEYGIPAVIGVVAAFLWWIRKSIQFSPSWGILVGALHAFVDFPFHLPGLLVFAVALGGSIEAHGKSTKTKPPDPEGRHPEVPPKRGTGDLPG